MLSAQRLALSVSSGICKSSALVIITVRGVFSSWEASATNCFCCCQACSTGRTIHRASATAMPRNTTSPSTPRAAQVLARLPSVAFSMVISANTRVSDTGVRTRRKRRLYSGTTPVLLSLRCTASSRVDRNAPSDRSKLPSTTVVISPAALTFIIK